MLGSHLFRTTTVIHLGPDTFDKLSLVITFLSNCFCSIKFNSHYTKERANMQNENRKEYIKKYNTGTETYELFQKS